MSTSKKATSALISVFHKDGLEPVVRKLHELEIAIYSTGGTEKFIRDLGVEVIPVEDSNQLPFHSWREGKNITSQRYLEVF